MMRSRFDEELNDLNNELILMGALCEDAISHAVTALMEDDEEMRAKVFSVDSRIDAKEHDIEARCLRLLLRQQPVARDLRQISSAMRMISDMERIGDQAGDIAEISRYLRGSALKKEVPLQQMAAVVIKMVSDSVDSFVHHDLQLAQQVLADDDQADQLFLDIKRGLVEKIAGSSGCGEAALDLLMIAKYLERIGDHATNISEWVYYAVTGEYKGEEL